MQYFAYRRTVAVGQPWRRYTKFLLVGAANAVVDLLVLNGLIALSHIQTEQALFVFNTIAVAAAIANSYVWNRWWTFADVSDGSRREKWVFVLQALVNILLNDAIVVLFSSYLSFSRSLPLLVSSNAAKGLAMLLSSSASYLLMRLFVFRARSSAVRQER